MKPKSNKPDAARFGELDLMHLILLFCLLGTSAFASDAVTKVIRTDYYEVSGTNAAALLAAMKAHRPFTNNAYTDWYIDWNYEFLTRPNECVLRSFDIRVQIRYTFPQWVNADSSETALRKEWRRYLDATTRHERGHSDIGIAAGKEMVRVLNPKNWRAATRKELKAQIDAECERILKQFKAQEIGYDKATDHGRTQGARMRTTKTSSSPAPPDHLTGRAETSAGRRERGDTPKP